MKNNEKSGFLRGLLMAVVVCLLFVGVYFWQNQEKILPNWGAAPALLCWFADLMILVWFWEHRKDNEEDDTFYQGR